MNQVTCLYSTIIDKTFNDVYHMYVINNGNFITTFVKSEKEDRTLTAIPYICWKQIDKMRQQMIEEIA